MPEYLAPGVFVEETGFRSRPIARQPGLTALVGPTVRGPASGAPRAISSYEDFVRVFGGIASARTRGAAGINHLAHGVRAFFNEGGRRLHVVRVVDPKGRGSWAGAYRDALRRLDKRPDISVVAAPGHAVIDAGIAEELLADVERPGAYRFAILETPPGLTPAGARNYAARYQARSAAIYYPWVVVRNPAGVKSRTAAPELLLPPSGFVAGIYARTDETRGVHKAPANMEVVTALRLERNLTTAGQAVLNPLGINCLRPLAGRKGFWVWGARTRSADPEWKYVNVRRCFLELARTIDHGTQWVVFEPNDMPLWVRVRGDVTDFLHREWLAGSLQGAKAEQAFFVRCDRSTMTQADISAGRLICLIGLALIKPAEFLVFRLEQKTAGV